MLLPLIFLAFFSNNLDKQRNMIFRQSIFKILHDIIECCLGEHISTENMLLANI